MPIQLGTQGQAGFDQPFVLMMDCHRRIEGFLGVLERVVDRRAGEALDEEAVHALNTALRYFREAAPKHTADEEDSLFPALRALDRDDLAELLGQAETLESQHRQADQMHACVDELAQRWIDEGELDAAQLITLRSNLGSLRTLYRDHIAFEDHTLFPEASRVLSDEACAEIGREMAQRRGLRAPGLGED